MEYTNDEESWTSKIAKKILKHKLLTMSVFAFLIFSAINTVMIINFLNILQSL